MHLSNYYCNTFDENLFYPTQLDYDLMTGYDTSLSDITDMDQLKQFKDINVDNWNSFNVFDWIADTAVENGLCYNTFNAKSYNHIDGQSLRRMSQENWIDFARSREAGLKLFQAKQNLFDEILSMERMPMTRGNCINSYETIPKNVSAKQQQQQVPTTVVENPAPSGEKRKAGRPPKGPKSDHTTRRKPYGKIWEFLDKLLSNKDTCPSLIKWDDYKAGTFKFVQPKKVAELWGLRKNNSNMDYNKFTRALRYHYKKGYLNSVEEKRLVYKFGPRVIELRTKSENIATVQPQ